MTTLLRKDFDVVLDPDAQELESRRYAEEVFSVIPLRSGRVGVLASMREPFAICDTFAEAVEAAKAIPRFQYHRDVARMQPRTIAEQAAELDSLISGL